MSVFEDIKAGLTEAVSIAKGEADPSTYRVHVPSDVDVAAIRRGLKMTQAAFANAYGFPAGTVRDWEQGRSRPDTAARAYLIVIARNPEAVRTALSPDAGDRKPARKAVQARPEAPGRGSTAKRA